LHDENFENPTASPAVGFLFGSIRIFVRLASWIAGAVVSDLEEDYDKEQEQEQT